jgi:DNA-directed RNA polymerase specialized sigma24 family protein
MRLTVDQKTQHLVALAQEGDESALNQLCKVYWSRVLWIVRLRMGAELRSKLESIDIVQDVLINVFRDLKGFKYNSEGDFLRWLSKLVENRLRGKVTKLHAGKRDIRKEVRLDSREQTTAGGFIGNAGPIEVTTPSLIMSRREDLARLEKAIDTLKPEYKEIADRLGKSDEAVRKQVSRALEALIGIFENV